MSTKRALSGVVSGFTLTTRRFRAWAFLEWLKKFLQKEKKRADFGLSEKSLRKVLSFGGDISKGNTD